MNIKNNNPLVSILIPCWGCREYITQAVESALNQDYDPIEVLVVEDCGDDGTYEEVLKIKDERLILHRNEKNLGQYANKNQAMRLAKGNLIVFLDGDDILEEDCVSRLFEKWQTYGEDVGIVLSRFRVINNKSKIVDEQYRWGYEGKARGFDVLNLVARLRHPGSMFGNVTGNLFYRPVLESIGGFPDDNAGSGDIETYLKLLCSTDVYFMEGCLSFYRIHPDAMSLRTFGLKEATS
ncbi:MAG: glycosyltransferase family 2 protein, partial [Planctomycetota bacterium]